MKVFYNEAKGFTLLESILYIGLFSALFTGILTSVYPLFSAAQQVQTRLLLENESNFILSKIEYALTQTMSSSEGKIISPLENTSSNELIVGTLTAALYTFTIATPRTQCTPPRLCSTMTLEQSSKGALPLSNERILVENFKVHHTAPNQQNNSERTIDISFTVNGRSIGPVRYFLRF